MARPLRIEYEGAFYHVTARGNENSGPTLQKSKDWGTLVGFEVIRGTPLNK